jgi:hypothetical protein
MKKKYYAMSAAILLGMALSGCSLLSLTGSSTDGTMNNAAFFNDSMGKEASSASLLFSPSTAKLGLKNRGGNSPISGEEAPSKVSGALSKFDALSLDDYQVTTTEETSDRDDYAKKVSLAYTLPDGTVSQIVFYYQEITTETSSETTSVPDGESTDGESTDGSTSDVVSTSEPILTSEGDDSGVTSETTAVDNTSALAAHGGQNHDDDQKILHSHGYAYGFGKALLQADYRFVDWGSSQANAEIFRVRGIAIYDGNECTFLAEKIHFENQGKTYDLSAFALLVSDDSYLAVEQTYITKGDDTRSVYLYANNNAGDFSYLLLQDTPRSERYMSLTPESKTLVNRLKVDAGVFYEVHLKNAGEMPINGLYQKIAETDDSGNVTYVYVTAVYSEINAKGPMENDF